MRDMRFSSSSHADKLGLSRKSQLGFANSSMAGQLKQLSFFRQAKRTHPPAQRPGDSQARPVNAGTVRHRLGFLHITLFFVCWMVLISGRLVWLQVVHHKDFVDRAARQQQRTFEVAPRRGILYDRNLHELAMTVLADSVYAVPSEIADRQDPDGEAKRQAIAAALAKVVHTDPPTVSHRRIRLRPGSTPRETSPGLRASLIRR